jgi:hypothetical protein
MGAAAERERKKRLRGLRKRRQGNKTRGGK